MDYDEDVEERAICAKCKQSYSLKRKALGYFTCLQCGEAVAQKHLEFIQTHCLVDQGHKQGLTLLSSDAKVAKAQIAQSNGKAKGNV